MVQNVPCLGPKSYEDLMQVGQWHKCSQAIYAFHGQLLILRRSSPGMRLTRCLGQVWLVFNWISQCFWAGAPFAHTTNKTKTASQSISSRDQPFCSVRLPPGRISSRTTGLGLSGSDHHAAPPLQAPTPPPPRRGHPARRRRLDLTPNRPQRRDPDVRTA